VFRAEEIARAKIAEANYKLYFEKQKGKTAPQREQETQELPMEVISDSARKMETLTEDNKEQRKVNEPEKEKRKGEEEREMRIMFWNARGLGKAARRRQVKEHVIQEKLDIVALLERMKQNFTDNELRDLGGQDNFSWCWTPTRGHSGGLIVRIKMRGSPSAFSPQ
jgi:hypothetical protein